MMMDISTAAELVATGVSLLFLWFLFSLFYRRYRIDLYRQRMFELRQELFRLAADGNIDFDDPAYGITRTTLNGFIRFAHRVTWLSLLAAWFLFRDELRANPEDRFDTWIEEALMDLHPLVGDHVRSIVRRMNLFTLEQLVFSSTLLLFFALPVVTVLKVFNSSSAAARKILEQRQITKNRFVNPVDTVAFQFGRVADRIPDSTEKSLFQLAMHPTS